MNLTLHFGVAAAAHLEGDGQRCVGTMGGSFALEGESGVLDLIIPPVGGLILTTLLFLTIPVIIKIDERHRSARGVVAESVSMQEEPEEFEEQVPEPEEPEEILPEMDLVPDSDLALDLPDFGSGIGSGPILKIPPKFTMGQESTEELIESTKVEEPPRAMAKFSPKYPRSLLQKRIAGRVIVRAVIEPDGTVGNARVKESSGHAELDRAAVKAIGRWRYRPARNGGQIVRSTVIQPFNFKVQ